MTTKQAFEQVLAFARRTAEPFSAIDDREQRAQARAALDAWERREPLLRDDALLAKLTDDFGGEVGAGDEEAAAVSWWLLDWFDKVVLASLPQASADATKGG